MDGRPFTAGFHKIISCFIAKVALWSWLQSLADSENSQYLLALEDNIPDPNPIELQGTCPKNHDPRSAGGIKGFTLSGSMFEWV